MSNIDKISKEALREVSEDAQKAHKWEGLENGLKADGYVSTTVRFIQRASPQTVLALLDELEAKDNRINRLEAIVAVAEQRNALMREWKRALKVPCDLVDNQVPVVIHGMVIRLERLKETEAKLEAAENRIAELSASHGKLREAMAGIHNTISGEGAYTPLAAILNASKRAYEESASAAGKGE